MQNVQLVPKNLHQYVFLILNKVSYIITIYFLESQTEIKTLLDNGKYEQAFTKFKQYASKNNPSSIHYIINFTDEYLYSAMMSAHRKQKQPDEVLKLLEDMKKRKISPKQGTYVENRPNWKKSTMAS